MYKWAAWWRVTWDEVQKRRTLASWAWVSLEWHGDTFLALQPGSSQIQALGGFYMEGSLHNWLNHWPIGDWVSFQPCSASWEVREWANAPTSNHLVGSPGNQPPSVTFPKLLIMTKGVEGATYWNMRQLCVLILGNSGISRCLHVSTTELFHVNPYYVHSALVIWK